MTVGRIEKGMLKVLCTLLPKILKGWYIYHQKLNCILNKMSLKSICRQSTSNYLLIPNPYHLRSGSHPSDLTRMSLSDCSSMVPSDLSFCYGTDNRIILVHLMSLESLKSLILLQDLGEMKSDIKHQQNKICRQMEISVRACTKDTFELL